MVLRTPLAMLAMSLLACRSTPPALKEGSTMNKPEFEQPKGGQLAREEAAMPYPREQGLPAPYAVKQKHEEKLMAIEGVTGVGVGQDAIGNETIVVYVTHKAVAEKLPKEIEGLNVRVTVTGPIEALPR